MGKRYGRVAARRKEKCESCLYIREAWEPRYRAGQLGLSRVRYSRLTELDLKCSTSFLTFTRLYHQSRRGPMEDEHVGMLNHRAASRRRNTCFVSEETQIEDQFDTI